MAPRTIARHFPVAVAPGSVVPAPAPASFLPTTWWGWTVTGLLVVIALYACLMFLGMHTGAAGILPVTGNSMGTEVPWGSHVFILPGGVVRSGDLVIARVGGYKSADDPADSRPATVVKKYDHGRLISTSDATTYGVGEYALLGRVGVVIPVQCVFRWLDKGAATPGMARSDKEQTAIDVAKATRENARAAVERARGLAGEETPLLLGPAETRSMEATVPVPQGTVRVAWEMRTPPLMPEGRVTVRSGGKTVTQTVPPDDFPVKGGMEIGGSQLRLAASEGAAACCTLRFYTK